MKPRTAFILRFMLPPFYAAVALALIVALFESHRVADFPMYAGLFALYAYVFAGLPAALFALLLGRFSRRRPASGGRLARAALLGLAAGLLITAMFGFATPMLFLPLGTGVGLGVEATVVLLERRHSGTH